MPSDVPRSVIISWIARAILVMQQLAWSPCVVECGMSLFQHQHNPFERVRARGLGFDTVKH